MASDRTDNDRSTVVFRSRSRRFLLEFSVAVVDGGDDDDDDSDGKKPPAAAVVDLFLLLILRNRLRNPILFFLFVCCCCCCGRCFYGTSSGDPQILWVFLLSLLVVV